MNESHDAEPSSTWLRPDRTISGAANLTLTPPRESQRRARIMMNMQQTPPGTPPRTPCKFPCSPTADAAAAAAACAARAAGDGTVSAAAIPGLAAACRRRRRRRRMRQLLARSAARSAACAHAAAGSLSCLDLIEWARATYEAYVLGDAQRTGEACALSRSPHQVAAALLPVTPCIKCALQHSVHDASAHVALFCGSTRSCESSWIA